MSRPKSKFPAVKPDALFDRIVTILEQARGNVVRAVNTNMVLAYWLIGREIVEDVQRGKGRAEYGKQVFENLSVKLTAKYGKGFSCVTVGRMALTRHNGMCDHMCGGVLWLRIFNSMTA